MNANNGEPTIPPPPFNPYGNGAAPPPAAAPGPQHMGPPPYTSPYAGNTGGSDRSWANITGFVTALLCCTPAAIIFSHIGVHAASRGRANYRGLGIAGLIIGYVSLLGWIIYLGLIAIGIGVIGWDGVMYCVEYPEEPWCDNPVGPVPDGPTTDGDD